MRLEGARMLRRPPRVAGYAASDNRVAFNEYGISRRDKAPDV
jgi:hypothetical protein